MTMKFSLTSIALASITASASARSYQELEELAKLLGQHGRKLQLSETYGFNSWGDSGTSVFDAVQDQDPVDEPEGEDPLPGILDIVTASEDHTSLLAAFRAAFVDEELRSYTGQGTLFAPNDEAFAAIAEASARYFGEDYVFHLLDILLYHFTEPKIMSSDLVETNITMANGEGANITLDPPMINDATIIAADLEASNGVVHVVDTVLLPDWLFIDVAGVVSVIPELFSTLGELVETAGLLETLQGEGPFTIFAPTNFAFNQSADAVAAINESEDPLSFLEDVLLFHVVQGTVLSYLIEDGTELTMANGGTATITIEPIYAMPEPESKRVFFEDYDKLVEKLAAASSSSSSDSGDADPPAEMPEEAETPETLPTEEGVPAPGGDGDAAAPEPIDFRYLINGVEIIAGDFFVGNGVIHVLDEGILVP